MEREKGERKGRKEEKGEREGGEEGKETRIEGWIERGMEGRKIMDRCLGKGGKEGRRDRR